jgi:hypothetical protein
VLEVQELAPWLSGLLYNPVVPDRPLHDLLEWAEAAAVPGSKAAFRLPQLRAVLPALVRVFIASHTYRLEPGPNPGDDRRLVLDDTGHGRVVTRIMALATEVIAPLHGEEGRILGESARRDLAENLSKIIEMIERR